MQGTVENGPLWEPLKGPMGFKLSKLLNQLYLIYRTISFGPNWAFKSYNITAEEEFLQGPFKAQLGPKLIKLMVPWTVELIKTVYGGSLKGPVGSTDPHLNFLHALNLLIKFDKNQTYCWELWWNRQTYKQTYTIDFSSQLLVNYYVTYMVAIFVDMIRANTYNMYLGMIYLLCRIGRANTGRYLLE